ncbi:MAG TPA: LptF/LptG family permease [Thermodesulfovibrionales bacterium]|jgi:lipopolysaccharide export system permease protein|nr:LptF/LptG family permease [Thermodesulfovibrionales bacterium]
MTIIQRYYLKEFFRLFAILALGLALISSLIELIDKVEGFIQYNAPVSSLLLYSALNIPRYLVYLMPVAALMSCLFVFGQAGRRKETVAVKASGGSTKELMKPFIFTGIVLCVVGLLMSEFVAPDLTRRAHKLKDTVTKRENVSAFKEGTAWLRARDCIIKIDLYLPDKGLIKGVSIMRLRDDLLTERIEAESGEWRPVWGSRDQERSEKLESTGTSKDVRGTWYLEGVTDYDIKTGEVKKLKEMQSDIIDSPNVIGKGMQQPEEMNVRELFAYTKRLKEAGVKNTKLLVDIYSRLSYPLINVIMLVVGISLATRGEIKSGLVTTAIGIFISLLYWLGFTASLAMGYTGILRPIFAAWLVPLLFCGAALYLFRGIPE